MESEKDSLNEQKFSPGDKAPIIFDFEGEAIVKDDRKFGRTPESRDLIRDMNSELSVLTDKIKSELKTKLPPGAEIQVDIEFSQGSIDWVGLVTMANIALWADNISFIEYVAKAVRFAVNKVVRRRIEVEAPVEEINTRVTRRREPDPVHPVSRFLWWCAGAVAEILEDSKTEHVKYQSIGGAVLTTGVLAFFSGSYAVYTLFEDSQLKIPIAVVLGIIWALAIFNLDRYIVSSMRKEGFGAGNSFRGFMKELGLASPRLLLAIVIGITVSKPLELRLMQRPIQNRIDVSRDTFLGEKEASVRTVYAARIALLDRKIDQIDRNIQAKANRARDLEDEFHKEMDGTGGSGRYGYSTVAQQKEEAVKQARRDVEILQQSKARLQSQRDAFETEIQGQMASLRKDPGGDFFTRMMALSELTRKYDSARWANYFVIFFLILLETTPVLVKLLSPIGPYDVRLNVRNEVESRAAVHRGDAMKEIIAYHYRRLLDAERHAEDMFFPIRDALREERLRQVANQWRSHSSSGQAPTFEELEEFVRDNVFTTRRG